MKSKTDTKPSKKSASVNGNSTSAKTAPAKAPAVQTSGNGAKSGVMEPLRQNPHGIPDYRTEVPNFTTTSAWTDGKFHYTVKGDFQAPAPAIRESKYLNKEKSIQLYRWMWLNRKMETALENLFKQQKVIGGVY